MKKSLFLSIFLVLLTLSSCAADPPRDPDPRDISPEDVAYVIIPGGVVEDRELIDELTDSLNGLRSELGVYEDDSYFSRPGYGKFGIAAREPYGGSVEFFDKSGGVLAAVVRYDGKVYRDHYRYEPQKSILFDRDRLKKIREDMPEGVSRRTELYFELMWGADKVWVEDTGSGRTTVITDRDEIDRVNELFTGPYLRVDEPWEEGDPCRFRVRWTYTEEDELLEESAVGEDGRVLVHGSWCTALGGELDTSLLEGDGQ